MKVAFFHGLDSEPITQKNIILREVFDEVYDPFMDYRNNPNLFNEVLDYLKDNPVDLIIGSSMGGYFAYCLSTHLGTRTLLFNPAMHSRPIEPTISLGDKVANHYVILGKNDDVIDPIKTIEWFNESENVIFEIENMGHVIDLNIFKKYLMNYKF
jgi:predicted esterase YcpF (UPF0227 family)